MNTNTNSLKIIFNGFNQIYNTKNCFTDLNKLIDSILERCLMLYNKEEPVNLLLNKYNEKSEKEENFSFFENFEEFKEDFEKNCENFENFVENLEKLIKEECILLPNVLEVFNFCLIL